MIIHPDDANALIDAELKSKDIKKYYDAGKFYKETPDIKTYAKRM